MPSLKANVFFNFLNTITGIIFPVITFPYAARVLLPDGIGAVNFIQSIINYIVLLTSLGIPLYAVREIAKYRDDINSRNVATVEIILLSLCLCLGGYIIVWVLGEYVPQIHSQLALFYVLSLTILFTSIGVNWFYQAIEDFKFITIRSLLFRLLAAAALFIFVKSQDDLLLYAFVIVGSTVGNNFINFVHLRKYISFSHIPWRKLRIWRHLKPSLHIFVFNLITSIYLNLNTVMLGFMQGDVAVGLYTSGNKISHIILNVVASLGVVMLPRCSNLIGKGNLQEFASITQKSYRFVLALAVPSVIGLIILANPVITVFCGGEFLNATTVLCWTAPIIIFVGLSNVIGIQILYPQGKENLVIWSTVGGAILNFLLNLWLIPVWSYTGAAISTFAAELIVLVIQVIWGFKYIPFSLYEKKCMNYVFAAVVMASVVAPITIFFSNIWFILGGAVIIGGLVYILILWYLKDSLLSEIIQYVCQRIKYI